MDANITPAASTTPAIDFDGYLMMYLIEGEGPEVWRVTADPAAWCETCSANPESTPAVRMYRTVALSHAYDPELGICQDCLEPQWEGRVDPRTPPTNDGAAYMYPPVPPRS